MNIAHPIYYPTTTVIIDDNEDFLINFSLSLDDTLAYQLFSSPHEALLHINSLHASTSSPAQYFNRQIDIDQNIACQNLLSIDIDKMTDEVNNEKRYEEISVAIVDYDMPTINGLELCKLIRNPGIKKVLLTGVADEKIAVEAFNKGIIDKFILKNNDEEIGRINKQIREYQHRYFQEKYAFIKSALNSRQYGFLLDPAFIYTFEKITKQFDIAEYYLTFEPNGYLLVSSDGELMHLVIMSHNEFDTHLEVIREYNGPIELMKLIESRQVIPNFWKSKNYYTESEENWRDFIFPCQRINNGAFPYYYAIVEAPPYYAPLTDSYNSYIEYLDR